MQIFSSLTTVSSWSPPAPPGNVHSRNIEHLWIFPIQSMPPLFVFDVHTIQMYIPFIQKMFTFLSTPSSALTSPKNLSFILLTIPTLSVPSWSPLTSVLGNGCFCCAQRYSLYGHIAFCMRVYTSVFLPTLKIGIRNRLFKDIISTKNKYLLNNTLNEFVSEMSRHQAESFWWFY